MKTFSDIVQHFKQGNSFTVIPTKNLSEDDLKSVRNLFSVGTSKDGNYLITNTSKNLLKYL